MPTLAALNWDDNCVRREDDSKVASMLVIELVRKVGDSLRKVKEEEKLNLYDIK